MKTEQTATSAEQVTFSLRLTGDLNEKILAEAEKEKRSRQAQIEYSLEKLFKQETKKAVKK